MAGTRCAFGGCDYAVPDGTLEAMAPVVLTTHSMTHATGKGPPSDRSERFKRPIISSGGTRATVRLLPDQMVGICLEHQAEGQGTGDALAGVLRRATENGPLPQ